METTPHFDVRISYAFKDAYTYESGRAVFETVHPVAFAPSALPWPSLANDDGRYRLTPARGSGRTDIPENSFGDMLVEVRRHRRALGVPAADWVPWMKKADCACNVRNLLNHEYGPCVGTLDMGDFMLLTCAGPGTRHMLGVRFYFGTNATTPAAVERARQELAAFFATLV